MLNNPVTWKECFVPGRVCLLGEHSDWAGMHCTAETPNICPGRCLAYGTPCGIYSRSALIVEERKSDEASVMFRMTSIKPDGVPKETLSPLSIEETKKKALGGGFFSYVYGTITVLLERYGDKIKEHIHHLCGSENSEKCVHVVIDNYRTDLPIGKGLSSSAAVCVTVARCFSAIFDLDAKTEEVMDIAFSGEILTGSECGRLDQCVAFGQSCVDLHFRGAEVEASKVHLPPGVTFFFVVADLNSSKNTKKILHELGSCFPNAENDPVKEKVQEFLGHVSMRLVEQAVEAVKRGDAKALGAAFIEYQKKFDSHLMPVCSELRAPRLHEVLSNDVVRKLSCGGKGVGSQGDGSVQLICTSEADQKELVRILEDKLNCRCIPLSLSG